MKKNFVDHIEAFFEQKKLTIENLEPGIGLEKSRFIINKHYDPVIKLVFNKTIAQKSDFEKKLDLYNFIPKEVVSGNFYYIIFSVLIQESQLQQFNLGKIKKSQAHSTLLRLCDEYIAKQPKTKRLKWALLDEDTKYYYINGCEKLMRTNLLHLKVIENKAVRIKTGVLNVSLCGPGLNQIFMKPNFICMGYFPLPIVAYPDDVLARPKDWAYEDGKLVGAYNSREISTNFIRRKRSFKGRVTPKRKLLDVINGLQQQQWKLDVNIDTLLKEISKLKLIWSKPENEDYAFQTITTVRFLEFVMKYPNCVVYFPFNIDFRGRIYPVPVWGMSPTACKHIIRQCLRTHEPYKLDKESCEWLLLKLGLLTSKIHKSQSYKKMIASMESFEIDEPTGKPVLDHTVESVLHDLSNRNSSSHLIQMDATCSVYQIIGILFNSQKLMQDSNLLAPEESYLLDSEYVPKDIYNIILDIVLKELPFMSNLPGIGRELIKTIVMPIPYGKTVRTSAESIRDRLHLCSKEDIDLVLDSDIPQFIPKKEWKPRKDQKEWVKPVFKDLSEKFHASLLTEEETQLYYQTKVRILASHFVRKTMKAIREEYPEVMQLMELSRDESVNLSNFKFDSPFIKIHHKYHEEKKTKERVKTVIDGVTYVTQLQTTVITDVADEKKMKTASPANYCHSCDGFLIQGISLDFLKTLINIYPLHDCIMIRADQVSEATTIVRDNYIALQKLVSKDPLWKKYHEKGSIPITGRHMMRIAAS